MENSIYPVKNSHGEVVGFEACYATSQSTRKRKMHSVTAKKNIVLWLRMHTKELSSPRTVL